MNSQPTMESNMSRLLYDRRALLRLGLAIATIPAFVWPRLTLAAGLPEITTYRNPGCGCCEKWAMGLQADGFIVKVFDDPALDKRRADAGVPAELAGCHTAFLGDYVIEGHVPSEDIVRFLGEKPAARGLAVAGMPIGSPGMETNGPKDQYDVMLFTADGTSQVYARH
jgi:hypothetical protein